MSLCKQNITINTTFECGGICKKWNDAPISKIKIEKNNLIQTCTFFDSGVMQNRLFKWIFRCKDHLFYESDWGGMNDFIPEVNNTSTYGTIKLGSKNNSIIYFINTLPSTKIISSDTVVITLSVIDCDGIPSVSESNKYKFNKK